MRRRKKPGALAEYLTYSEYIIDGENSDDVEILKAISEFVQDRDFELELGSGCTGFLLTHASRHPEKVYLAIEFKEELLLKAVKVAKEQDIKNIRFLRYRIEKLDNMFRSLNASKIYLNFSDPWPKARHEKRRLTHPNYLNMYKNILKEGGYIEFKTDNDDMFDYSLEQFKDEGFELLEVSRDLHSEKEDIIMSEYEKKYSSQGQKIKYLKARFDNC